jgi:hypothetical protein
VDTIKDCSSCRHNPDDGEQVPNRCFSCLNDFKTLRYYPYWEDRTIKTLGDVLRDKLGNDNVNSPKHYTTGGIETIDFIKAKLGTEGTVAYCMGNVLKYSSRWQDKNGLEDLKKAQWYLNYAVKLKDSK